MYKDDQNCGNTSLKYIGNMIENNKKCKSSKINKKHKEYNTKTTVRKESYGPFGLMAAKIRLYSFNTNCKLFKIDVV